MRLPVLRADLQLSPAAAGLDGAPRWTLADPLRGRYFQLSEGAIRLLRHWHLGDERKVLAAANAGSSQPLGASDIETLLRFLRGHELVLADAEQRGEFAERLARQRQGPLKRLLHSYLFFRIPLWRPDPLLQRLWPWLARYGARLLRIGLPLILIPALLLVARDWDRFVASFPYLFSFSGLLAFGAALLFAKLCHEFGHALMARRAGCRVHSMGLAFMVMFPLFYTDVSDAWRVSDRRSRLLIGGGGVLAELLLACVALLAWSLLPDGPLRTAAFLLGSVTWVTTVLVNLNPFMRFDGYFLLSDLWGVDNLQQRAFALCRWRLGEWLFGFNAAPPEALAPGLQRRLLLWGYAAWIWRAVLFLGIALAVYHFFFKLLGIVLMLVELGWFIGLPVARQLGQWWQQRADLQPRAGLRSLLLLGGVLAILLLPWRTAVEIPAQLEAARFTAIHAPEAARLKALHVQDGQTVVEGELLLELESPDQQARRQVVASQIRTLRLQLRRLAARSETASDAGIVEQQLAEAVAEYRGLEAASARLQLRAPHAGVVRDLPRNLQAGRWLAPQQLLGRVVASGSELRGYVAEQDLWRIAPGDTGRFIADDPAQPAIAVTLRELAPTGSAVLELESLASDMSGPIAVRRIDGGKAEPVGGQYAVRLAVSADSASLNQQPRRGLVLLQGRAESLLGAFWRRLAVVAIRESGF